MPSPAEMSEVVRRADEAFNRRDLGAFRAVAAPGIEIHDLPDMPTQRGFRGPEALERFFEDNWGTWETVWGDVERILEAGPDRVLVLAKHAGRTRGGPEIAQARGVLVTFAPNGKINEIRFFADPGEALAAAGLNEHNTA